MIHVKGYAAQSADSPISPHSASSGAIPGRMTSSSRFSFAGCATRICTRPATTGETRCTPMVPGHEIVGRVVAAGSHVARLKVGDFAGVGCMVDSCRHCAPCEAGLEQYCVEGATWTYNAHERGSDRLSFGGYSEQIVVDQRFVVKIPAHMDLKAVAPLFCAGITTYSPLRHWKVGEGQKVGIVGLGGLGHMGVKFAKALGAHVVMVTTSPEKGKDALRLGADEVLVSKDLDAMARAQGSFEPSRSAMTPTPTWRCSSSMAPWSLSAR